MIDLIEKTEAPQKAPSTIELYERLYRGFERRIIRQERLEKGSTINPAQVAIFFNESEGGWESKTARLYRAAITYGFIQRQAAGDEQAKGAIELLTHEHDGEEDRLARQDDLRRKRRALRKQPPRGPRQKVKRFSKEDTEILVKHLIAMRSKNGPMAAMWFIATTLTGLRPCEWQDAKIDVHVSMQHCLVVRNAKATNGRAHSPTRTIILSGATDKQKKVIATHMKNIEAHKEAGTSDDFYRNCRRCVERSADHLWPNRPRHPTLYTARHMFSADAKSVFDKVHVAALMGHASIETAGDHYAQRWTGSGSLAVEPDDADVAAVVGLNKERLEIDLLKREGGSSGHSTESNWILDAIPKSKASASGAKGKSGRTDTK